MATIVNKNHQPKQKNKKKGSVKDDSYTINDRKKSKNNTIINKNHNKN